MCDKFKGEFDNACTCRMNVGNISDLVVISVTISVVVATIRGMIITIIVS